MKISVCIPAFNLDVRPLVHDLNDQIVTQKLDVEIVVLDDGSNEEFKELNRSLKELINYIELPENVGRAKIRNLFLNYTKGDFLLFLDCDGKVISQNFIANYLGAIASLTEVICGGRIYPDFVEENKRLSWTFGTRVESKSHHERAEKPYDSFMTNNFLIKRIVFETYPFNEMIQTYGHEDTLFGFLLKKNKIQLNHLNNPIFNDQVEENSEFLIKSIEAVRNLYKILVYLKFDPEFITSVRLLRFYYKLKEYRLTWLISVYAPLTNKIFKFRMKQGDISLFLFNIYKLDALHSILKAQTN